MEGLEKLLARIRQSLDKDANLREEVAQCIKEKLGFDIRLEDVSLKGGTLRIQTSPAKRSEIKLNEAEILEAIRARTKLDLKNIVY